MVINPMFGYRYNSTIGKLKLDETESKRSRKMIYDYEYTE